MLCGRCGAVNPDGSDVRFCRSCGGALTGPATGPLDDRATEAGAFASGEAPAPAATLAGAPAQAVASPYGGFWIRFAAYLIDGTILGFGSMFLGIIVGMVVGVGLALSEQAGQVALISGLIGGLLGLIVSVVYYGYLPAKFGATPGKLLLGYHLVGPDGRHLSFGRAVGRYFAYIPSSLAFGLGFVWIGIDERKQGWHDKIAGTFVVRRDLVQP